MVRNSDTKSYPARYFYSFIFHFDYVFQLPIRTKFELIYRILILYFKISAWDDPYLLGIVNNSLEIYTVEDCLHIQVIPELNKARLIFKCQQGKIYVASTSQVWCIRAVDQMQQIRNLLEQNQFQLALKLTVNKSSIV